MKSEQEKQKDALIAERDYLRPQRCAGALPVACRAGGRGPGADGRGRGAHSGDERGAGRHARQGPRDGAREGRAREGPRNRQERHQVRACVAAQGISVARQGAGAGQQGDALAHVFAKDITDEGKSRPVLANSLWAVVARFQSLQTRAKAELLASEARGATSAVDLR